MTDLSRPEIPTDRPGESAAAKLRALFDQLVDLPESKRVAWMTEHVGDPALCAALEKLLEIDARNGPFDTSAAQRFEHFDRVAKAAFDGLIGSRIGAYRIDRLLGQGGMATVFLAARHLGDFDQKVAIKLLRKGLYSEAEQRQFRREQRALAALTHPNIAYLIDGGITEAGLPYLILEFVEGLPLTQYAAQQSLNTRARLQLFLSICKAVAAAHRQLVVHRDLKPSNILVKANGDVKLLDFGIAKLLDDDAEAQTQTGLVALTPQYAAPEQRVGGTITTSTDVYALGVLLHELLIGSRPVDDEAGQRRPSSLLVDPSAHTKASPERAVPLTTLRQQLRGDLDNILLMALAPEPERRYRSAAEFADDIQRHLDAQPVLAHPPSRWYRVQKFVSRHRGGVTLGAILGIATISALLVALWQTQVARTQAQLAKQEAHRAQSEGRRAEAITQFVLQLLESTAPGGAQASAPDVPTLALEAAKKLPSSFDADPRAKVQLYALVGSVLRRMQRINQSREILQQGYSLAQQLPEMADRLVVGFELARTLNKNGEGARAEQILAAFDDLPVSQYPSSGLSLLRPGMVLKLRMAIASSLGDFSHALKLGARMHAQYQAECNAGKFCDDLAYAENDYGIVSFGAGEAQRGIELLQASLQRKLAAGLPLTSVVTTRLYLASIFLMRGEVSETRQMIEQARNEYRSLGNSVLQKTLEADPIEVRLLYQYFDPRQAVLRAEQIRAAATQSGACDFYFLEIEHVAALIADQSPAAKPAASALLALQKQCGEDRRVDHLITALLLAHANLLIGEDDDQAALLVLLNDPEVHKMSVHSRHEVFVHALNWALATGEKAYCRTWGEHALQLSQALDLPMPAALLQRARRALDEC